VGSAIPNMWFPEIPTYRSRDSAHALYHFYWQNGLCILLLPFIYLSYTINLNAPNLMGIECPDEILQKMTF